MKVISVKTSHEYDSFRSQSYHIEYYTISDDVEKVVTDNLELINRSSYADTMFINTLVLTNREDYMEVMKILINSQVTDKYDPSKDKVKTIIKYRGKDNK